MVDVSPERYRLEMNSAAIAQMKEMIGMIETSTEVVVDVGIGMAKEIELLPARNPRIYFGLSAPQYFATYLSPQPTFEPTSKY